MFKKKLLISIFLILLSTNFAFCDETINARNNAYIHNNKGLIYLNENYYFGAIKEFQMAIDLNPNTQASATFYTNLGKTYEKVQKHDLAKPCFEKALSLHVLYFDYYLNLAKNYKNLGILDEKIKEYSGKKNNPLNEILLGLMYVQAGKKQTGITILDDFCNKEPRLTITNGVQNYIKEITG